MLSDREPLMVFEKYNDMIRAMFDKKTILKATMDWKQEADR